MSELKITHKRLYEQVIQKIESLFESGEIVLGERIPSERELVEMLGVSRGTLRDAFRILESHGVIETKAGGGRYLRKNISNLRRSESLMDDLEKAAVIDLLEAREILELGMIELICERADDDDIAKLEEVIYKASNEHKEQVEEFSFNLALAECSKNIVMINFMKLNMDILKQTKERSFVSEESIIEAQKEHLSILKAIKERDVKRAKKEVINHLENVKRRTGAIKGGV
ncbi:FadR/GntR family transcriptional regulator [Tenuibacillus multivorans]|uniref:GntR family transcriptional regulator, transcriptional repressor for pyruvate dehydrogenase complex n=1 Tax=Tenuibacillus multivorans TaxID=237069 RepID=A0A1H0BY34_9BACI|nr:FadR/GntR family transcriptional regulator [Tenuibacillus multivorans]GEL78562.1 GntR family transcriptional regulator [Tenuibacillus multivorans]SDN50390.1 GntR family transcriptional regulator, transcriptional repressor for pyruvate dehydrogenase complex [Tenuibacillus multivorans]